MKRGKSVFFLLNILVIAVMLASCAPKATPAVEATQPPAAAEEPKAEQPAGEKVTLHINWFAWAPADQLSVLVKDFTKAYPNIEVVVDTVPAGQWYDKTFTEFASGKTSFDIAFSDSQWIGQLAVSGYAVDLTDWANANLDMTAYHPFLLAAYGMYPQGETGQALPESKLYGVPAFADGQIIFYRKDWFEDPAEKEAFKTKYGYELAPPQDWNQIHDIAEFFTRPDKDMYGVGFMTNPVGDSGATSWNQVLWNFGGSLWDAKTGQVEGVINNEASVKSLEFEAELVQKYMPEGGCNWSLDEVMAGFNQGKTAMTIFWAAFGPSFLDPNASTLGKTREEILQKVGFSKVPGLGDNWFVSLGGMGMIVSAYSPNKEQALEFIKWYSSKDVQVKWVRDVGGFTTRKDLLADPVFLNANPYNPAFAEVLPHLRDFWNIPEYGKMLAAEGEEINAALCGIKDPKTALDDLAGRQQQIIDETGRYTYGK